MLWTTDDDQFSRGCFFGLDLKQHGEIGNGDDLASQYDDSLQPFTCSWKTCDAGGVSHLFDRRQGESKTLLADDENDVT